MSRMLARILDLAALLTPRRRGAPPASPKRIGLFLLWGIGDAVQTLPFLTALRQAYPEAKIVALGKSWLDELFAGQNLFDERHDLTPPWTRFAGKYRFWDGHWRKFLHQIARLRRERFDLLVGLRPDPREVALSRVLRADAYAGLAEMGGKSWISLDLGLGLSDLSNAPGAELAAHAAKRLTGLLPSPHPRFPRLAASPLPHRRPVLAVSFGASQAIRRWNGPALSRVLAGLRTAGGTVLMIDHPDSPDVTFPPGWDMVKWRGGLNELPGVLASADLTFCTDSGVMHIADAAGGRLVALFTSGNISRFAPPGQIVYSVEPMPCRPCFDKCIYASPRCVDGIDEAAVAALLDRALTA
jgi:ADP-heptose:LPS heptosyltransferase